MHCFTDFYSNTLEDFFFMTRVRRFDIITAGITSVHKRESSSMSQIL